MASFNRKDEYARVLGADEMARKVQGVLDAQRSLSL